MKGANNTIFPEYIRSTR